ncbi:helix-turn-helix transcriptional regulator [Phytoactinopolyspora limicola]|uniref:helix-turn-helix transcriptional regulator n=1 Tax=Phytoactinopolyspora limicola TaxID=2715536 RepID=UPI00140BEE54|nr:WYL domain-containing protein [Phytoactinopolyspora limicola]
MAGGRDQIGPLERLIRILVTLDEAEPRGLSTEDLIEIAGYGSTKDPHRQLNRDVTELRKVGWDIRNTTERGVAGRYRLHARDTRLRVDLAPRHQVQLVRAALAAGATNFVDKLGDDLFDAEPAADAALVRTSEPHRPGHDALDKAAYATERRCLIGFRYKHRWREVHPHLIHPGASGWYLVGHEDADPTIKRFVTDRMADVVVDQPGTATVPDDLVYEELNPITWTVDPPIEVVVETAPEHRQQVEMMLGSPLRCDDVAGSVRLTIDVTHRAAFRARLYELGTRVRVVGPDEVRAEIIAELERFTTQQELT